MATAEPLYVPRFSRAERIIHWVHSLAFFVLLATGIILYLPGLAGTLGSRGAVKAVHLYAVGGWAVALLVVIAFANRRALRRTVSQLEYFDEDDLDWLTGKAAPQGRFNAGQKAHTIIQAAFTVLFVITGLLMLYGEIDTSFRLSASIVVHDGLTFLAAVLVLGHIYLSLVNPPTRPAMRGIIRGDVLKAWAAKHHAKWEPSSRSAGSLSSRPVTILLLGGAVTIAAIALILIPGITGSGPAPPTKAPSSAQR